MSAERVVVVTGGASGIGLATALRFAAEGCAVVVVGRRADAVARACEASDRLVPEAGDVRDEEFLGAMLGRVGERWGGLDVLVNNAGVFRLGGVDAATAAAFDEIFGTNVLAPALATRLAVPLLERRRGCVVNVTSTYARKPAPGETLYAASKLALEGLTRSWAAELAPRGIRVNAVAPGPTRGTELLAGAGLDEARSAEMETRSASAMPIGRMVDAAEVAGLVVTVAGDAWAAVTGQVVTIDGGLGLT